MAYIPNMMERDHWHVLASVRCKVKPSLDLNRAEAVMNELREWGLVDGDYLTERGECVLEKDEGW